MEYNVQYINVNICVYVMRDYMCVCVYSTRAYGCGGCGCVCVHGSAYYRVITGRQTQRSTR